MSSRFWSLEQGCLVMRILSSILIALFGVLGTFFSATAQQPVREIVNITGDLYRAQSNNAFNVFLVTREGIILTDPISRDFAVWLKRELDARFDIPVRYVLYSHHHWDHASGGAVFAETADFIGHENMLAYLALPEGEFALPAGTAADMDVNGNGLLERSEASGSILTQFDLIDENRDGVLNGAELIRGPLNDVHPPNITFSGRHTITLDGKTVVSVPTGSAHSRDMTVVHFPEERVLFGADVLQVRRLPIGVDPTIGDWIDAYQTINDLDFDIVVPGHGILGEKADLETFLRYLEELSQAVATQVGRGVSLQDARDGIMLDSYAEWERYDVMLPTHIEQIYRTLKGSR